MTFTSPVFALFVCLVVSIYYLLPFRLKHAFLLLSGITYLLIIDLKTCIVVLPYIFLNYLIHRILVAVKVNKVRKFVFISSIVGNIFFLGLFKYLHFAVGLFLGNKISTSLPLGVFTLVGVSFFSFKTIHFLIDTYTGEIKKTRLMDFLNYLLFFPQFLSGPIQRFQSFVKEYSKSESGNFFSGIERIGIGIFKKTVIADRLGQYVNPVFNDIQSFSGFQLVLAIYFYAFQIYFDFSGYTDIAVGVAKLLGINIPENFKRPYAMKSIREFWKRWHISLSMWFRDYVYIPLGGNRKGKVRSYLNILFVFGVTGLWHGANTTFIIWGLLHGLFQILGLVLIMPGFSSPPSTIKGNWYRVWSVMGTLVAFHLVAFAWIFFRANSLSDAFYIITHLFAASTSFMEITLPVKVACILAVVWIGLENVKATEKILSSRIAKVIIWIVAIILLLLFGVYGSTDFLYFRF